MTQAFVDAGAPSLAPFVMRERGLRRLNLLVEGARCSNCIAAIEAQARAEAGVTARFNLTLNRLTLEWRGDADVADACAGRLRRAGYRVAPFELEAVDEAERRVSRELLKALAVAGFASSNVMMLAVAVWAGQAHDMPPAVQHLLQWLSMIVATPAVLYAGGPFYRSAWRALKAGRTNMDVPISLGVILTLAMSIVEAIRRGADVYFDSALALLFVLLVGRWFEHAARKRSRAAVQRLAALRPATAEVVEPDGAVRTIRADALSPAMTVRIRPGETCPADAVVVDGRSDLDVSLVTGESLPAAVGPGDAVLSGSANGRGLLTARVVRAADDSHLASVVRLVEAAEARGGRTRALADRVAAVWTPVVHGAALATFIGWWLLGGDPARAMVAAVSVLIIACPCAVGLAVPTVQVRAAGSLLGRGVLMRSGEALERLAAVDHVALDKTGTLTWGRMRLMRAPESPKVLAAAAALGAASGHPLSRAVAALATPAADVSDVVEHPGQGVSGREAAGDIRLGSWAFVVGGAPDPEPAADEFGGARVWFGRDGRPVGEFVFADELRPDAVQTVERLRKAGLTVEILSGDAVGSVTAVAKALGVAEAHGAQTPAAKQARLDDLRAQGRRVLMVGDGLNDAPSLAAADVSASFADAAGVSRTLADFVLPSDRLSRLAETLSVARRARSVTRQNLTLAFVYNAALAPLAMAGLVTPFWAAIAMAASSLTVTLNALRVGIMPGEDET